MLETNISYYGFFVTIAIAVALILEFIFLSLSSKASYNQRINKRLSVLESTDSRHDALIELRRKRGLSSDGRYSSTATRLNQLVLQSGVTMSMSRLVLFSIVIGTGAFLLFHQLTANWVLPAFTAILLGLLFPLLFLGIARRRRLAKFEAQLPDAIDIMVRSLKAGHPIPVAISMVSRETQDPIGSEFGMTADEITFGLELEESMRNMLSRVGQLDLALVAVAISIQSKTGGNLSEILAILSRVIRQRFKMKRKIRSLSAEGRFSAMALSTIPVLVMTVILTAAPDYYGDVWDNQVITYGFYLAGVLMLIGNFVMFRMVNFRF